MLNIFFITGFYQFCMSFDMDDSFGAFLKKIRKHNLFIVAFDVQELILKKYQEKGYSEEQIYSMRLGDLWPHIKSLSPKEKRY